MNVVNRRDGIVKKKKLLVCKTQERRQYELEDKKLVEIGKNLVYSSISTNPTYMNYSRIKQR